MEKKEAIVIGGGLAGCEAAWQLANRGVKVQLKEMKPLYYSAAHVYSGLAELVCSNSLKASRVETAAGLLKEEMKRLGSLLVPCAEESAVSAGGALAVDREMFSEIVTEKISNHPNIRLVRERVEELELNNWTIIATGPLTDNILADNIKSLLGGSLSFYDAAAPIVTKDSLNFNKVFAASRYDRGEADYLNCPMSKDEYKHFWEALKGAERAPRHDIDEDTDVVHVYEGCMPIEILASRGEDTIRFGPLKPVGLKDPQTGMRPYAVVQLRAENREGTLYNLVGFQTSLKFGEQKRVFSMIPGLETAEFSRFGVMHRNTFIDSPRILNGDFSVKIPPYKKLFFAGQITGVEGYMESAASGIVAGINLFRKMSGLAAIRLPRETMIGALCEYISDESVINFQPMGANMGILPELSERIKDKRQRYERLAERSLKELSKLEKELGS